MKQFKVKHAYSDLVCQAFETEATTTLATEAEPAAQCRGLFPIGSKFVLDPKAEAFPEFLVVYGPGQTGEFKTNWQVINQEKS